MKQGSDLPYTISTDVLNLVLTPNMDGETRVIKIKFVTYNAQKFNIYLGDSNVPSKTVSMIYLFQNTNNKTLSGYSVPSKCLYNIYSQFKWLITKSNKN